MGTSQQFSLRWNNYLRHITNAFDSLRNEEDLVDVTLSCEGKRIRAHKMLLSACSTYFRDLFKENPCQHPVIIFRNVKFEDLAALIDFMYQGEVNVVQDQLASFLTTAELLAVQGLSEGNGKDAASDQPKEVELPDSPILPTEPEVQLSNNQKSGAITSTPAQVASPLSFFPVDQRSESPPSSKRRKWSSGISAAKTSEKEESERRKTVRHSSPDPIEIIPVVPNLKLEMPDYMEQEQDASSCSYSDSNQGAGVQGGSRGESSIPAMSQLLAASDGTVGSGGGKHEPSEIYSTNSGDSSLPPPAEGLSASDISQILAKPGPSGEQQSQDSLQARRNALEWGEGNRCFSCRVCGKLMHHWKSVDLHMKMHSGETECHVCHKVLNRSYALKQHLYKVHGLIQHTTIACAGWNSSPDPLADAGSLPRVHACELCSKVFKHPGSLTQHMKFHMGETRCHICGLMMNRKYELRHHLRRRHNIM